MLRQTLPVSMLERLSLSSSNFHALRALNQIYIDKTDNIGDLAQVRGRFFLSRPRRFGKTLLLSTFASLFANGIADFAGLHLENRWKEEAFPVISLNFASFRRESAEAFRDGLFCALQRAFTNVFPHLAGIPLTNKDTPDSLLARYCVSIQTLNLVMLIDEYDAPIIHSLPDEQKAQSILDSLSAFFNTLKEFSWKFRFIFITGITRVSHVSLFSDVNFLEDISFNKEYNHLLGITEEELHRYFDPYIRNAATVLHLPVEDVYRRLKARYDGYQFSPDAQDTVYNPWSVLKFLRKPEHHFENYWYDSGGVPSILQNYITGKNHNSNFFFSLESVIQDKEILSGRKRAISLSRNELKIKSNTDTIPYSILLLQTGYYTLRYENKTSVSICLPNEEVAESLILLYLQSKNRKLSIDTRNALDTLPQLIDSSDLPKIVELFNIILTESLTPSSNAFTNENTIRDIIYMLIPDALVFKAREVPNAHGFSDMELQTPKTQLIIEFKRSYPGKSVNTALEEGIEQMRTRRYGRTLTKQRLLRVVIVLSTSDRALVAWDVVD